MKRKIVWILGAAVLLAAALGILMLRYIPVGGRLYPRNAAVLDLRDEKITVARYEKLAQALPDCRILWNVPFRNTAYPLDTKEITVTALTEEDVDALGYLRELETVHADRCRDYAQLDRLRRERPEVRVEYRITFGDGTAYPWDASEIRLQSLSGEDGALLPYFPELQRVVLAAGGNHVNPEGFRGATHNQGAEFAVAAGGRVTLDTEETAVLTGLTEAELPLLELLTSLKQLHIKDPAAPAEQILLLRQQLPQCAITWEVEMCGYSFGDDAVTVDLSAAPVTDAEILERKMEYLPDARQLILGLCGMDESSWGISGTRDMGIGLVENEDLAAWRERAREKYALIWHVRLGPDMALRTDAVSFSPEQLGVYAMTSDHARNLRYCENMVSLDIRDTRVSDIGFVEGMPDLKYLNLSGTQVRYIDALENCRQLVLLDLDDSAVRDYSPLVKCKSLEDLNIGKSYSDISPVKKMTWLKNLCVYVHQGGSAADLTRALPDTVVTAGGNYTIGLVWEGLENYQEMQKLLKPAEA